MERERVQRVVIIGGGAIGAASAYYLARSGAAVTVLEQGRFGGACSHGNCGLIALSHVLPLNEPGATAKALHALFSRNAPFTIRPRPDFHLWLWLARFAANCNERAMLESARARHELLQSSGELYRSLLADEGFDCEWEDRGCYFVYGSEKGATAYRKTDALLREQFGLEAEFVSGKELQRREPSVKSRTAGAFFYPNDSHIRPDRLMSEWRRVLEGLGVSIRERCTVRDIVSEGTTATGVAVDNDEIVDADHVVVSAGAASATFQRSLGGRMPLQPGKGYSITMPRPTRCPSAPLIFQEEKVAVTPMQSGYRLGSTMEFAGFDRSIRESRLDLLRRCAVRNLHEPLTEPIEERWFGWRPMTVDGRPIIDRAPRLENAHIAAGHNMLGISMAPATGKLVAELVLKRTPHIDPSPFRATRF